MNKLIMPLLAGVVLLAGCAGAKSDFECSATSSDSCMTIDAANNMARQKAKAAAVKPGAASLPVLAKPAGVGIPLTRSVQGASFLRPPVRTPETTAKVWVAPWVDGQDNFHEPGLLSFVVKPGEWHQ
ncbi:hypothetical protein E0669_21950 [Salmonella enterica subsp. enterica serovar Typhimurium]|nr:hypothetical protein [Salmonella enterica subsp. enterica serovar Potsdam]EBV2338137.1 hypothetical protein [Salmonella enterica subsp. enterica serovar Potsdam]ECB7067350.1 hypothetical protein [Salmonella enterica subsp. enterica serovar Typhimurium]EGG7630131.1 TraV family lipoprotein [Salmonella enterica subsp. enterica serovar Hvittingfoss]HCM3626039.1 TraV family lipoprotein [Salmonella enterica subsp. enterica serovar Bonn]